MLENFLNAKPLFYDEIDYSRMPRVYEGIKEKLTLPKIIHLIGTNGKGTTGRFLATALYRGGHSVGHYSSPHILEFNERIWLNGENADFELLELAHSELLTLLSKEDADSLSYFEYTTLLAMLVYKECEYLVLEAGLGGEHDATAVFFKTLTLVTPIAKDHEAFLGETIEEIATTKLNAVQKNVILAKQKYMQVKEIAQKMVEEKAISVYDSCEFLDEDDYLKISEITQTLDLPAYLVENLQLSIAALKFLKVEYTRESFKESRLFGRLTRLNERVIIDVGHNVLAAQEILKALMDKKYVLVYNSYKDKNYREILRILGPIIERVEIIEVQNSRIQSQEVMQETLEDLGYETSTFQTIKKDTNYLVFGSFSVVENFLKVYRG